MLLHPCYYLTTLLPLTQEHEDLLGVSNGVSAPAAATVVAPAAAVDEGSSLLSQYEQQEAFAADPTANGNAPGMAVLIQLTLLSETGSFCSQWNVGLLPTR